MGQSPSGSSYNNKGEGIELLNGAADYKGNVFNPKQFTSEPTRIAKKGDILLCIRATIGNFAIADRDYCIGRGVAAIRPNADKADKGFLIQTIERRLNELLKFSAGSTIKGIKKEHLFDMQIHLPPLSEQKHIAEVLDKADALVKKNKELLQEYNDLQQSIFLDMFGDPVTNPKGWEKVNLSTCYINDKEGTKCGPFGSALKKGEYVNEGVPVWTMENINIDTFQPERCLYITDSKFQQLAKYNTQWGDIIISRAGTVGKMCVVEYEGRAIISTNLIRLRLNNKKLLPLFFTTIMSNWGPKVARLKTGDDSAFTHMNTGVLNNIEIVFPPIDIQNKFASMIENIEQQKEKAKESLAYSEELFGSLVKRYFGNNI